MQRTSVVLPQPLGPRMLTNSRSCTDRLSSSTTVSVGVLPLPREGSANSTRRSSIWSLAAMPPAYLSLFLIPVWDVLRVAYNAHLVQRGLQRRRVESILGLAQVAVGLQVLRFQIRIQCRLQTGEVDAAVVGPVAGVGQQLPDVLGLVDAQGREDLVGRRGVGGPVLGERALHLQQGFVDAL